MSFGNPIELARYADVIVRVGVNLQPGQRLVIRADVQTADLVRAVAQSAYQAGARLVDVLWSDEQLSLIRVKTAPRDSFEEVATWMHTTSQSYLEAGDPLISISATTPSLMAGQDPVILSTLTRAVSRLAKPVSELVQRNASAWAVVSYPTAGWANDVLPDEPAATQLERLWAAISVTCRLDQPDPVAAWQAHVRDLDARSAYMNAKRYHSLRYRGPGTNLSVGLADEHIWAGAGSVSAGGVAFVSNLPTEEIFSLPHRERAEGTLRSTRPLNYGGSLIEDFTLSFSAGRVTQVSAAKNEEVLRRIVETDEGASRLGEIALVSASSPVARTGLLFANTLYDENAASHLALGSGYRFCVAGGETMDEQQFAAVGGNESIVHVDFMIGSTELDIDGVSADGTVEPVMRNGEWAFEVKA